MPRIPPTPSPLQPVLVIGNLSSVASVLWFGLSGSYWQAVTSRAVGGALNAIILAEKAMIGALVSGPNNLSRHCCSLHAIALYGPAQLYCLTCPLAARVQCHDAPPCCHPTLAGEGLPDRASQAKAFGVMSLCWGLGSLAGPIIGGSLAAPCSSALRIEALCGERSLLTLR